MQSTLYEVEVYVYVPDCENQENYTIKELVFVRDIEQADVLIKAYIEAQLHRTETILQLKINKIPVLG